MSSFDDEKRKAGRKRMNGGGGPRSRGGIDKIVSVRRLREKVSIRVKRPSGSGKTIRVRLGRRTQLSSLPAVRRARAAMRAVLYKAVLGVGGNARRSVSRTSRWLASCALRAAGRRVASLGTAVRAGSRRGQVGPRRGAFRTGPLEMQRRRKAWRNEITKTVK